MRSTIICFLKVGFVFQVQNFQKHPLFGIARLVLKIKAFLRNQYLLLGFISVSFSFGCLKKTLFIFKVKVIHIKF